MCKKIAFIFIAFCTLLPSCNSLKNFEKKSERIHNLAYKKEKLDKRKFIKFTQTKDFKFQLYQSCIEDSTEIYYTKYRYKFFNTYHYKTNDSLFVKFSFIRSCATEFGSNFKIKNDSLIINVYEITPYSRTCNCDYHYKMSFPLSKYDPKYIKVQ